MKALQDAMNMAGDRRVLLGNDQENAIKALAAAASPEATGVEVVFEQSKKYDDDEGYVQAGEQDRRGTGQDARTLPRCEDEEAVH